MAPEVDIPDSMWTHHMKQNESDFYSQHGYYHPVSWCFIFMWSFTCFTYSLFLGFCTMWQLLEIRNNTSPTEHSPSLQDWKNAWPRHHKEKKAIPIWLVPNLSLLFVKTKWLSVPCTEFSILKRYWNSHYFLQITHSNGHVSFMSFSPNMTYLQRCMTSFFVTFLPHGVCLGNQFWPLWLTGWDRHGMNHVT